MSDWWRRYLLAPAAAKKSYRLRVDARLGPAMSGVSPSARVITKRCSKPFRRLVTSATIDSWGWQTVQKAMYMSDQKKQSNTFHY